MPFTRRRRQRQPASPFLQKIKSLESKLEKTTSSAPKHPSVFPIIKPPPKLKQRFTVDGKELNKHLFPTVVKNKNELPRHVPMEKVRRRRFTRIHRPDPPVVVWPYSNPYDKETPIYRRQQPKPWTATDFENYQQEALRSADRVDFNK